MRSELERLKAWKGMKKRIKAVHPVIANAAYGIVMESYESLMHHNEHWAAFKRQFPGKNGRELEQVYLEWNWAKGVEAARRTLARMLDPAVSPSLSTEDRVKIHEALVLDKSLQMGRGTDYLHTGRMN